MKTLTKACQESILRWAEIWYDSEFDWETFNVYGKSVVKYTISKLLKQGKIIRTRRGYYGANRTHE